MRKLYVLALILAIQSPLFARIEKQQSAKTPLSNLAFSTPTPVLQLDDARWSVINSGLFLDKSVANRLVFGVNYNPAMVITQPTTFELTFTLQLTDASNVVTITPPQTLKIAFDPNGKTWKTYTDYAVFVSTDKHYKVGLLLNSLTVNGVAANNSPLKTSLFVQLEHEIERFYTIPSSPIVPVKPVVAYDAATRELVVTAMSTTQPEAVDVEWTYIDDYSGNPLNPSLNLTSTPYNFKNNATRVSLTDDFAFISPLNAAAMPLTTYRIPFVFEQGYVIFRTRALSYAGTGFDEPVYSSWSLADIGVQITNISAFHYQQVMPINVHEKNKNWQFSATFSEGGKSKNVVNYADGSSRLRQAVTKLSTDNFAIVGETIYDFQGRAAVQTLPAPTDKQYLAYFTKFSRAVTTNIKYNAQHFDADPASNCAAMPAAMSNTEGSERYYSASNPFINPLINPFRNLTPNTEGYPFVQTEFTPDLTGRIRRQSNVGKNHALGSTHETQYLYGKPFQEEIDRLFGTDIGWANHYKKNVVLDANGQASVSYVDLDGKAVATALIGGNPRNLVPLDDLANSNETITVDLLNKSLPNAPQGADNVKDLFAGTLTVNQELIAVGSNLPYAFQYQVTPERYQDNCLTTNCLDCVYDLNISLKDKCGNLKMPFVQQQIGTPTQAIISPPNPPLVCKNQPFTLPNLTATLSTGNYTLNKTLTVNQAALDYYTQIYLDSAKKYNVCLPSMKDLITASLQKIDTNGCHIDCQSCLTAIGTEAAYIARFAAQIGTPLPSTTVDSLKKAYALLSEACDELCREQTQCDLALKTMLADMMPHGQYAEYRLSDGTNDPSAFPLSVLNETTTSALTYRTVNGSIANPNWRNPRFFDGTTWKTGYFDTYNNPAKVFLTLTNGFWQPQVAALSGITVNPLNPNQATTPPENLADVMDFISHFDASWARSLVVFHPEYYFYESCVKEEACKIPLSIGQSPMNSFQFDSLLLATTTLADAQILFGSAFNIFAKDPYFSNLSCAKTLTGLNGGPLSILMQNRLNSFAGSYSVWQVAYLMKYPTATTLPVGNANLIATDAIWNNLKGLYLSEKNKFVYKIYLQYSITQTPSTTNAPSTTNGCIGNKDFVPFYNWFPSNFILWNNTCGWNNFYYYFDKAPRFPNPEQIGPFDLTDPSVLEQLQNSVNANLCGCPATNDFNTLLNGLAAEGLLTQSPLHVLGKPYLTASMLQILGKDTVWYATKPNNSSIIWENCPTKLSIKEAGFDLSKIVAIQNLTVTSVVGTLPVKFTAIGLIPNPPDSVMPYTQVHLLGETCWRIDTCTKPVRCDLTATGTAVYHLLQSVNQAGQFNVPNFALTNSNVPLSINDWNTLKSTLNALNNFNWLWQKQATPRVYQLITPSKLLRVTFLGTAVNFALPFVFIDFKITQSLVNQHIANVRILQSGIVYTVQAQFDTRLSIVAGNWTPLPIVLCEEPKICDTRLTDSLQKLFNGIRDLTATVNLSGKPYYAANIANALGGTNPIWQFIKSDSSGLTVCLKRTFRVMVNGHLEVKDSCCMFHFSALPSGFSFASVHHFGELMPDFSADPTATTTTHFTINAYLNAIDKPIALTGESCLNLKVCAPSLCGTNVPIFPTYPYQDDCVKNLLDLALHNATVQYQTTIDSISAAFQAKYRQKCLSAVENFTATYSDIQYHFTLYYYDQAQNLVRTVPPLAVKRIPSAQLAAVKNARNTNTVFTPPHILPLATTYVFNSLNQTTAQQTPDGGIARYWFDKLGRLTLSQNAKQLAKSSAVFSYTQFDRLGRIIEVGEINDANALTNINTPQYWNTARTEITTTIYDRSLFANMQNLRGRIGTVKFQDNYNVNELLYEHATHFSYDIHGNVPKMIQDIPALTSLSNRYKSLDYQYDLVSNKVNLFSYQRGGKDAFYHKYAYDADNRLTQVWTSPDAVIWAQDARYQYYLHGLMARTELGELKIQGVDYAYTAQGWIKAVNGNTLTPPYDMGKDGIINGVLRDAFGYSLHYFHDDYKSIGTTNFIATLPTSAPFNGYKDLWNGNIAAMTTTITDGKRKQLPMGMHYMYDQLQRLKGQSALEKLDTLINQWVTPPLSPFNNYAMSLNYDPNGNITRLYRNGNSNVIGTMDDLTYNYKPNTNQLTSVNDAVVNSADPNDIENGQVANNYKYDEIGNLTQDLQEGITQIGWTVYGKIKAVIRTGKPHLGFNYDASGNRLSKTSITISSTFPPTITSLSTYYVRDAQGNILSTYNIRKDSLFLSEQHIYGSSRLGVGTDERFLAKQNVPVLNAPDLTTFTRKMGAKQYELSNHLGNVLTTVSDRRIFDGATATFAEVKTSQDYYAFGMLMSGRGADTEGYRFGFNGKEEDEEWGKQDYGMRVYDGRLGRFLSVDPITRQYPELAPYQFASNTPIMASDLDGLELHQRIYLVENGKAKLICVTDYDVAQNKRYGTQIIVITEYGKAVVKYIPSPLDKPKPLEKSFFQDILDGPDPNNAIISWLERIIPKPGNNYNDDGLQGEKGMLKAADMLDEVGGWMEASEMLAPIGEGYSVIAEGIRSIHDFSTKTPKEALINTFTRVAALGIKKQLDKATGGKVNADEIIDKIKDAIIGNQEKQKEQKKTTDIQKVNKTRPQIKEVPKKNKTPIINITTKPKL